MAKIGVVYLQSGCRVKNNNKISQSMLLDLADDKED